MNPPTGGLILAFSTHAVALRVCVAHMPSSPKSLCNNTDSSEVLFSNQRPVVVWSAIRSPRLRATTVIIALFWLPLSLAIWKTRAAPPS